MYFDQNFDYMSILIVLLNFFTLFVTRSLREGYVCTRVSIEIPSDERDTTMLPCRCF